MRLSSLKRYYKAKTKVSIRNETELLYEGQMNNIPIELLTLKVRDVNPSLNFKNEMEILIVVQN